MFKPQPQEFNDYYSGYVSLVPETDIREAYAEQPAELRRIFEGMDESKGAFRYADEKWTIKEILSHLIDGERIFSYRMLRISRGDETPIEGFEQDGYIENSRANDRAFLELLEEFELIRKANVLMIYNLDASALSRMGNASGFPVSVRALANISIGHVRHHISILNERYLPNLH